MFEAVTRSVAGLAFGLIVIGLILTIRARWKNGKKGSAKTPIYMGLHYLRFLSWILLGCVLGGLWPYIAGRALAVALIPIIWLQARSPRPQIGKMLLACGVSVAFASLVGTLVYLQRDALEDRVIYFESAVVMSFLPQVLFGNPSQIRRYLRGPLNGESVSLHVLVAVNSAAWALYGVVSDQIWMWVCYGAVLLQEGIMIGIIQKRKKGERKG